MKKIISIVGILTALTFTACKTTEANYRAAYEIAKEKQLDGGDETVSEGLRNELQPKPQKIGNDTLPVRMFPVGYTKDGGLESNAGLKRYNVAVARFRQLFNAKSMRERLINEGFPDAIVVHDREMTYYVIAGSTSDPNEVKPVYNRVKDATGFKCTEPFPYVIISAYFGQ